MSFALRKFSRWNKDRTESIRIEEDHDYTSNDILATDSLGFPVLTLNDDLAFAFGTEAYPESLITEEILHARKLGSRIFYLELTDEFEYKFRLCDSYPVHHKPLTYCAGVLIVPKESWQNFFPRKTFASRYVFRILKLLFDEDRVNAILNDRIYKAIFTRRDGSKEVFSGFTSREYALDCMLAVHPSCCFSEEKRLLAA